MSSDLTSVKFTPAIARIGLMLASGACSQAQESQFTFDPNGNLLIEAPATVAPPQILSQPQPQVVGPGELASFFVLVADSRALTYQWRFNDANISGATNETLLLTSVGATNEGQYSVVLVNPSGSVTSAPAALMIDNDLDHMADSWELANFGNLNQYGSGDFDGDGVSDLQEFLDDTSPTNSASALFRLTVLSDGGQVSYAPDKLAYTNGEPVTLTATAIAPSLFHGWTGDLISRSNPATLFMTGSKTVWAHFQPESLTWTNLASGSWHNPSNWNPNFVPLAVDDAVLANNVTVTINEPAECRNLTFTAGTLTGNGHLTLHGNSTWPSGTMSGSGRTIIAPGATLTINNNQFALSLGRALENGGTVVWAGNAGINLNNVVITNRAGALFQVQNAQSFSFIGGAPRLDNAGTFRKSGNSGTTTFNGGISFNNYNAVEIQTGTLLCSGSFLNNGAVTLAAGTTQRMGGGGSASGMFSAPATALVDWTVGTFTLSSGAQLNGDGLYRINGATLACNTDVTVQNLTLLVGTLGGSGVVTANNAMIWSSSAMTGSGRTIIAPGATLTINNPSFTLTLSRALENGGTVVWTGGAGISLNAAVITNRAGALFHVQNAQSVSFVGGAPRFDNAGTFRKSGSSGTTTFNGGISFNNYNAVEIQNGTLVCSGSFLNNGTVTLAAATTHRMGGGGSASGTFSTPATALVDWAGGTFSLNTGAQLNGDGLYRINGATLACNTDATVQNLNLFGAALGGPGLVTISNAMTWPSGTMSGSGRTIIAPGATLTINNNQFTLSLSRALENGGTVVWTGGAGISLNNVAITNRAGALFHVQNAQSFSLAGGAPRFDNVGTFRKSGNSGTTTFNGGVNFNNYGTVEIRTGILAANGSYTSTSGSSLNCALGGTTPGTGYGRLQKSGAITLNGGLSVDLLPGFTPATNDTFTVVTAGTLSGAFASFFYPSNDVTMQLSNTPNSVIVRVTDVLAVPRPLLLQPELVGPDIKLTWTAVSNVTYRLEFNPDMNPSNWSALSGDVTSLSNTAAKLDALTLSNRLYRVRIIAP